MLRAVHDLRVPQLLWPSLAALEAYKGLQQAVSDAKAPPQAIPCAFRDDDGREWQGSLQARWRTHVDGAKECLLHLCYPASFATAHRLQPNSAVVMSVRRGQLLVSTVEAAALPPLQKAAPVAAAGALSPSPTSQSKPAAAAFAAPPA